MTRGQLDVEGGSHARFAFDRDAAAMIGDDGLDDGEPEAGAMLFRSVVWRENSFGFFGSKARSSIGNFERDATLDRLSAQHQNTAGGHSVHGVKDQILDGAMEQSGELVAGFERQSTRRLW